MELTEARKLLERAVLACAQHILGVVDSKAAISSWFKSDSSLVTSIDLACEEIAVRVLGEALPVVSEETGSSHDLLTSDAPFFLCDPIDGTTVCKRFFRERGGQVGYGPLVGFVQEGVLRAAAFYHVNRRLMASTASGEGVAVWEGDPRSDDVPPLMERTKLPPPPPAGSLRDCSVLYYLSRRGEARYIEYLKLENIVFNCYRFGGFANDAIRLALGFEEVQFQFAVKAWDLPACLFATETGSAAIVDPLGKKVPLSAWRVERNNPVLVAPPALIEQLIEVLEGVP